MLNITDIFNWLDAAGIKYLNNDQQKLLGRELLGEEYEELREALFENNKVEILDGSSDLVWIIINNLRFHNITAEEFIDYFNKVSVSNWSKFCTTEEEAQNTVDAYQEGWHWDKPGVLINCYYTKVGDKWGVFRNDGKILKSLNYKDVKKM